jgi:FAD/FMN-containing dehydrogenase
MIHFPKNAEEVSVLLSDRTSPIGISYGENEQSAHDIISFSKLQSVIIYEPEEMIISVEAGIALSELEKILSQNGQWLPMLVADESPDATLGDAIIHDNYHPRSATMGMLRTAILGGTFCTTDGVIFKSGSRVVKSVAGYDIHRAFCGSQGLFGAMISVTLKVQPKPERFFRFIASTNKQGELSRYAPSVCELVSDRLIVELAGFTEDIDEDIRLLREQKLIDRELDQAEWTQMIRTLRAAHPKISANGTAEELLIKVRDVFDPKGILR